MNEKTISVDKLIKAALDEDLGKLGDITTMALFDEDALGEGQFISEEQGIISGIQILERCFFLYDHSVILKSLKKDSDKVKKGEVIAEAKGRIRSLLAVERTALNFLSHLSGIATLTNVFVEEIKDTNCKLMDTRKTVPGLRLLEKMAVKNGGGLNHRIGLFDAILIKDNHLAAKSIADAVVETKKKYPGKTIEIEVENLQQVKEALDAGADILLLDNMEQERLVETVRLINGKAKTEASGGVTEQNIRQIAQTGVDYISSSAITMTAPPIDIKFELTT